MADNVAVTAGSGTTIAADDVGGVLFQRVKVCYGVDGTGTDVNATTPLPVTLTVGATLNATKTEDAAHASGDVGNFVLGVVTTSGAGTSVTDGDYAGLTLNAVGGLRVTSVPDTVGGLSIHNNLDIDETEDAVKASAGQVYGYQFHNPHSAVQYVKLYNDTVANVIVGTTAATMTIGVPAAGSVSASFPQGIAFSAAITIAGTLLSTTADATAPTGVIVGSVLYK